MNLNTERCAHYAPEEFWKLLQSESNAQPTEAERVINPIAAVAESDGEVRGLDFTLCDLPVKPANYMPASRTLREKVYFPFGKWQSILGLLSGHQYEAVKEPLIHAQGEERLAEAAAVALRYMAKAMYFGYYPNGKRGALLPTGLYDQKTGEALCVVLAKIKGKRCPYRLDSLATVPFSDDVVLGSPNVAFPETGVLHLSDEPLAEVVDVVDPIAMEDARIALRKAFAMCKMHPEQAKPCWLWSQQQHGWKIWVPELRHTMLVIHTREDSQGRSHYSLYKMV